MAAVGELKEEHTEAGVSVGDRVANRYLLERFVGEGGMGIVWRALDEVLDRRVAVKIMRPELVSDATCRARLLREARAAARLHSEHIARVLEYGVIDSGVPYIVYEFLKGKDLNLVLAESGPLPVTEAVDSVLEACEALAEAHANGIVHRDLKPENLFRTVGVDETVTIKVLDFGVAKAMNAGPENLALTHPDCVVGSPNYMAPEQLRGGRTDARVDIWALGAILYELLTGDLAFPGETLPSLWDAFASGRTPRPSDRRADVSIALDAVVERCLARDPAERFADIGELARALAPFGSRRTVSARTSIERLSLLNARPLPPRSSGIGLRAASEPPPRRGWTRLHQSVIFVALGAAGALAFVEWLSPRASISLAPSHLASSLDRYEPPRMSMPPSPWPSRMTSDAPVVIERSAEASSATPQVRRSRSSARARAGTPVDSTEGSGARGVDAWDRESFGGRF